jgi:hypothetical protein
MGFQESHAYAEMNDEQFRNHALEILRRELGVDGMARFLLTCRDVGGEHVRAPHTGLEELTVEQILVEMGRNRKREHV